MNKRYVWCLLLCAPAFFSRAQSALPAGKKAAVFLLIGQSNMAGRGVVEAIDTLSDPRIFTFNKEEKWVPAREPLAFDKPVVVGVGPGFAFAKEMAHFFSEELICLVPSAVGGTKIDLWKPGAYDSATRTHPYDDAIRRVKNALAYGELKGIIWHQGESDANPALSGAYEFKLRELIQRFRDELKTPTLPFIVGEIKDFKPEGNKEVEVINSAIRKVAHTTRYCFLAESRDLHHKGDFIHFDAASARELGKRYAAALKAVISLKEFEERRID